MNLGHNPTPARGDLEQGYDASQAPIPLQPQPSFQPPQPSGPRYHPEVVEAAPPPGYYEESALNRPPPVYQKTQALPGFRVGAGVAAATGALYGPLSPEETERKRKRKRKQRLMMLLVFVCGIGIMFGILNMTRQF
ncbi:hypothetical protein F5X68DRAFT_277991 [Plectosphaerella plurivora]|uniref:Uncharacterized protein n=1 Tax=Plectosphaerella plurivora TaxID=936078 RepID=A0A9P8V6G4_9PEZI|nr:hypothetical protein F5X68DRAFT_277991 [Plectosphaerella plurivora]